MVEQDKYRRHADRIAAREILRGDEGRAARIVGQVRGQERASLIARMREPDAKMVEFITTALACEFPSSMDDAGDAAVATLALSAAADAMEVGDAGSV